MLAGRVIAAHNATFDLAFLRREFSRAGEYLPALAAHVCTMELPGRLAIPDAAHGLRRMCRRFGVPEPEPGHRALGDALATAQLLLTYIRIGGGARCQLGSIAAA